MSVGTAPYRPPGLDALLTAAAARADRRRRRVAGLGIRVRGVDAAMGDLLHVGDDLARAEVVAVTGGELTLMPHRPDRRHPRRRARPRHRPPAHRAHRSPGCSAACSTRPAAPSTAVGPSASNGSCRWTPSRRPRSTAPASQVPLHLGVRALDTLTTVGRGQRIGLFAGSGVGKSSLLSMIARGTDAEVTVIALVGERGREVREFLEDDLGPEGLARSVVVVSTSDEPALMRLRAAFMATRIAEAFRDAGSDVVLMMDSLTRVAMAQREIGLSVGEPPATRGYPPSRFRPARAPARARRHRPTGSITGLYTVLVDGDDHNEPIADAVRSILDGHIVLDRKLADRRPLPVDRRARHRSPASRRT